MSEKNNEGNKKYGVNPDVMKEIVWTERDEALAEAHVLIQAILRTPPEEWDEDQLFKAKAIGLNKMSAKDLRHWMDNEAGGDNSEE